MNAARRILLATTASLALIFTGAAGFQGTAIANTGQPDHAAVTDSAAPAPSVMTTVMRDYNTQASKGLKTLQVSFNKHLPAGVAPIVFVDWDKVATWYGMPEGPATVEQAIGDYLHAQTGRTYDAQTLSLLAQTMNNKGAEGIITQRDGGACLVVPEYPGTSFDSFYAASLKIGGIDLMAGKTLTIGMSTAEFAAFVNGHEGWHCLDTRYIKDSGDGLEGAVKQNRAEMFADVGIVAESIQKSGDLSLIDKAIAVHTAWAYLTGPAHAKMPENDPRHFDSIAYTTQSGLSALKERIQTMGLANFRKLDRDQLRALDYEITDAHCLTYAQAQGMQSFYATGKAPAAVQPLIDQLRAVADAAVRPATPAELAARAAGVGAAKNNGGLTERMLLTDLKARAGQLGGVTSLAGQLNARAEMTDSLRAKLSDPGTERVAEAQLQMLLYSNPHLTPRK